MLQALNQARQTCPKEGDQKKGMSQMALAKRAKLSSNSQRRPFSAVDSAQRIAGSPMSQLEGIVMMGVGEVLGVGPTGVGTGEGDRVVGDEAVPSGNPRQQRDHEREGLCVRILQGKVKPIDRNLSYKYCEAAASTTDRKYCRKNIETNVHNSKQFSCKKKKKKGQTRQNKSALQSTSSTKHDAWTYRARKR